MITFKDISIIVPVGPFEPALEAFLKDLRPIEKEAEIIVVKGSQRARQLNEGAQKASRDFLWFLHADSRFSSKTLEALLQSLNNNPHALHYFNLRFLPDGPPLMFINEIGCWIRSRIFGVPFGDQGFAVSKENFERLGSFPEKASYGEDHLFVWRARQKRIRLRGTGAVLYTSARRYAETGWAKLTWSYACRWTRQAWPECLKLWCHSEPQAKNPVKSGGSFAVAQDDKHLNRNVLVIFAKYPEAGKVKSRLAGTIGKAKAASAYKTMVEIVVRNTKPCNGEYERILYYAPPESGEKFQSWLQMRRQQPQSGGDLGERMEKALIQALAEAKHAVLIGTDCITVDRPLILKAFQNLKEADLVLGPAKDGGYYLIGCKKITPKLFSNIAWSTEHVFSQTLKTANALKLSVSLLPELEDIDMAEQYGRFREKIRPDIAVL